MPREERVRRIAKSRTEDEALRIDQNRLTNVLDEFFNDLIFYEQTVAWMLEDQVSREDVADAMERELESRIGDHLKIWGEAIIRP